ncbi:hypothetical protein HGD87_05270 [Rhodobacteraceae bacterium R_SAG9]|nr:hypothetical protein [Rhodobacteraceae bacterium R_SAG9]
MTKVKRQLVSKAEEARQLIGDRRGSQGHSEKKLVYQQPPLSPDDCMPTDGIEFDAFVSAATTPRTRVSVPVSLSIAALDQFDLLVRREQLGKVNHGPKTLSEASLLLCGVRSCVFGDALTAAWISILLSLRFAGKRHFPASEPFITKDGRPDIRFDDQQIIMIELEDGAQLPFEPCEVANSCMSPVDGSSSGLVEALIPDRTAFIDAMRRNALYGGTEWTTDGERYLQNLLDCFFARLPTPQFIEKGLLECELVGLVRREHPSRLMVSISHGMQAPLRLVGSTAVMISRLRFQGGNRPHRYQTSYGTASGTRRASARNQQSGPQRNKSDLKAERQISKKLAQEWIEALEEKEAAEYRERALERKYDALLQAVKASGNKVQICEDGMPVINPVLRERREKGARR